MASRKRRGECRRRENRGPVGAEGGLVGGAPLPNRLRGLGKRRKLAERGPGGAPAENEFGAFCGR